MPRGQVGRVALSLHGGVVAAVPPPAAARASACDKGGCGSPLSDALDTL